ncbi:unnamed protein product [Caenorhabditis bovis]|uniref:Uncharacterized protein n=1 Tax=Caenorhabditis bovis TaxID=2654633 RepID=A0A8S1E3Z4_9PELO|nr:unnamed protein product [Caenorhabditis bovis]
MILNIVSIAGTLPMVVAFVMLAVLLIMHSKSFHPLFTASFSSLVISYAICNLFVVSKSIIEQFDEHHPLIDIIDYLYLWSYCYIQPCVVVGLLETLTATIFASKYENSRHWVIFFLLQVLSCLIILFYVNRRLSFNSRHKSALTVRYQLTENVKALRIFVPFVIIDNCISLMYVFSSIFFNVDVNFDIESCRKYASYMVMFFVFRIILILAQFSMPVIVVKLHSSMWSRVQNYCRKPENEQNKVLKINNVLGMDVAGIETDYFTQLQTYWAQIK